MVLITFIHQAIVQAISMLFGATGEIMTEKSGNLNLGIWARFSTKRAMTIRLF